MIYPWVMRWKASFESWIDHWLITERLKYCINSKKSSIQLFWLICYKLQPVNLSNLNSKISHAKKCNQTKTDRVTRPTVFKESVSKALLHWQMDRKDARYHWKIFRSVPISICLFLVSKCLFFKKKFQSFRKINHFKSKLTPFFFSSDFFVDILWSYQGYFST